jgi:hypothetical protein
MVSEALRRMRQAHDSGAWRAAPEAAMVGVLSFMEAVDPEALLPEERDFVTGFVCVMTESIDEQAKGGAA